MAGVAQHVEVIELSRPDALEIHISATLTREDYQTFLPRMEALIEQHGKISLLVWFHEFHGWTAGALWEDIKFDARHFSHIRRLAIIGENRWEQAMAAFCRPFTTANVRYFDQRQLDQARQWIEEAAST